VLEARLEACKQQGFAGVLLAGLDGRAGSSGFGITAEQQLDFSRRLAAAAHERGLAAGFMGSPGQKSAELAAAFDFLVDDACLAEESCKAALAPWRTAGKPAYLVAYTNVPHRIAAFCAQAKALEAPVIFKTLSLNGKLHRRCLPGPG
jgi:hypothetical protein